MARTKSLLNQRCDIIRDWFDNCDPTKTQTRDRLKKAANLIWQRQTLDEQEAGETRDHNGIGYGAFDVKFADRIVHWDGTITVKMAMAACKMLRKYSLQFADIALKREASNGKTDKSISVTETSPNSTGSLAN